MSRFKLLSIKPSRTASLLLAALMLVIAFAPAALAANIGVSIGTGKVVLDQPIKPGITYDLPSLSVFNNGDVSAEYEMTVEYNQTQPQLKPAAEWVTFSPKTFNLKPGKAQEVKLTIRPSSSAKPGDYFAYLEAHPNKRSKVGGASVQIAAAAKFEFKIIPANIFQRILYALQDFWNRYKTIILVILGILALFGLKVANKKFFKIQISRSAPAVVEPPKPVEAPAEEKPKPAAKKKSAAKKSPAKKKTTKKPASKKKKTTSKKKK